MISRLWMCTVAVLINHLVFSQEQVFMPLDYQQAYEIGTRSHDGNPGENYWQNRAHYSIDVDVIPGSWAIVGSAKITYYNQSPDSLNQIVIRTYPDHYKTGAARDTPVSMENITEGMQLTQIQIGNESYDLLKPDEIQQRNTYFEVLLKSPLTSQDSIEIEVRWQSTLPLKYKNRIGAYDDKSAFIGYWYPQIGVYDDLFGWDKNEYLGRQEFYRDFADFEVSISVPGNFLIWATGELENAIEVYGQAQYAALQSAASTKRAIPKEQSEVGKDKTWKFIAKGVQDFAFAVSSDFRWEQSGLSLGTKEVISNMVFPIEDSVNLNSSFDQQMEAIRFFSEEFPGIEYPYSSFTSFWGVPEYDGQEFPMMANNGSTDEKWHYDLNHSIMAHELAHSYFPFHVGVNEVKHAWMEEGWAIFMEATLLDYLNQNTERQARNTRYYSNNAGQHWESPLFVPSNQLINGRDHTQNAYLKSAIMYFQLQDLLGEDEFKKATQVYIQRWAGKHPTPFDWMKTVEDVTGQGLGWFWNPWIFNYGYPDLALKENDGNLLVSNEGSLPVGFKVHIQYEDGSDTVEEVKADHWKSNDQWEVPLIADRNVRFVELLNETMPDTDTSNNRLEYY